MAVTSIMHSPAFTIAAGTDAIDAARLMSRERISSVFVVENGRPTRIVAQTDLLTLVVGITPPTHGRGGVEDVYVEVTGLRGSSDPALLADIDHLVAGSLKRIAHHVRPILLSLHLSPHSTHRTSDLTVEARLLTDAGIFYASHTGWNLMAGISGLMDELTSQVQRIQESRASQGPPPARRRGRGSYGTGRPRARAEDPLGHRRGRVEGRTHATGWPAQSAPDADGDAPPGHDDRGDPGTSKRSSSGPRRRTTSSRRPRSPP